MRPILLISTMLLASISMTCMAEIATKATELSVAQEPTNIHQNGFVYCVDGSVNTFNPQLSSSGLIIDPLAAQLYDRLLDVDPYTYRLSLIHI